MGGRALQKAESVTGSLLFQGLVVVWVGGWVGGVEEERIMPSQLSSRLKLKLKLSLAINYYPRPPY